MEQNRFSSLPIQEPILQAVQEMGFQEMTEIQSKAIPPMLEGRDVIAKAPTGTGKTCAFGIPLIERIDPENPDIQAVILAPTRELATQIRDDLEALTRFMPQVRTLVVYGGQSMDKQKQQLKKGAHILVATPGRLLDLMQHRYLSLKSVTAAVLDEADKMLDMGFYKDVRKILDSLKGLKQMCMFSATISREVMDIGWLYQRDPEEITVLPVEDSEPKIEQYSIQCIGREKIEIILRLMKQFSVSRAIIFCNTKRMVEVLTRELNAMGLAVEGLHGDMAQGARTRVMAAFKEGKVDLLVATDVAARGIDASGVDIIINYDIPQDMEYYVHRIGRTGRAGNTVVAFTLIAGSGEFFSLCDIQDTTGIQLTPYYLTGLDETSEDKFYARNTNRSENGARRSSLPRPAGQNGGRKSENGGNAVLSIDVGSNHDVTEKQIVNAILKYSRIKKDEIGTITIKEDESLVELAPDVARHVLRTMEAGTVNEFLVNVKAVSGLRGDSSVKNVNARGESQAPRKGGYRRGGHRGGRGRK